MDIPTRERKEVDLHERRKERGDAHVYEVKHDRVQLVDQLIWIVLHGDVHTICIGMQIPCQRFRENNCLFRLNNLRPTANDAFIYATWLNTMREVPDRCRTC